MDEISENTIRTARFKENPERQFHNNMGKSAIVKKGAKRWEGETVEIVGYRINPDLYLVRKCDLMVTEWISEEHLYIMP